MPFLLSGDLVITAIQDLGGLGSNESEAAQVHMDWSPPIFESMPWLLLAGLLWMDRRKARGNRWLLLAMIGSMVMQWIIIRFLTFLPDSVRDILLSVFTSLLFGNTIMWLFSARLANTRKGATFMGMMLAMIASGAAMLFACVDIYDVNISTPAFIFLLILSAITLLSYEAASRCCKSHPGTTRFILLFAVFSFVLATGGVFITTLFGGIVGWPEFFMISGCFAAGIFVSLLPVLLVLFQFEGQQKRLFDLLHLSVKSDAVQIESHG